MSNLTFQALRAANASRAPRWHTSEAGMMEWTIGDWFMAMAGEVGEGADEFLPLMFTAFVGKVGQLGNMAKKYRRVQEGIANKSDDPERQIDASNAISKMFNEIADVQIYLDLFALRLREALNTGEDIGNHVERVFNNTSEKYGFPERLIDGQFMLAEKGTFRINGKDFTGEVYRIPDDPEPFTMRLDGDMTLQHVADAMGMPIAIVKDDYDRALQPDRRSGDRRVGKHPGLGAPYGEQPFNERGIVGNTEAKDVVGWAGANIKTGDALVIGTDGLYHPINTGAEIDKLPMLKQLELQNAEFDAVAKIAEQYRRITLTAPVDDDYPMVRGRYESAMMDLLRALKNNGRTLPPWR